MESLEKALQLSWWDPQLFHNSFKYRLAKGARKPVYKTKMKTFWYVKVQQFFKPTYHYKLILEFFPFFVVSCLIIQAMDIQYQAFPNEMLAIIFAKFHVFSYKITDFKHMFIVISSVLQHIYFILECILSKILFIDLEQKEVFKRELLLLDISESFLPIKAGNWSHWNLVKKISETSP